MPRFGATTPAASAAPDGEDALARLFERLPAELKPDVLAEPPADLVRAEVLHGRVDCRVGLCGCSGRLDAGRKEWSGRFGSTGRAERSGRFGRSCRLE